MRNLTLISSWDSPIPRSNITEIAFDLDENVIYVSSEHNDLDGGVEIDLWKIDQSQGMNKTPVRIQLLFVSIHPISRIFIQVYPRVGIKISYSHILEWTSGSDTITSVYR